MKCQLPPPPRRASRQLHVGAVPVGGGAPISVQTMTNTDTCDVQATVAQLLSVERAGADIARVSVPSQDAAKAFAEIRQRVSLPLVADIHFDHLIALSVLEQGVDCLRLNPGNIGREPHIRSVVDSAREHGVPLRIGVNAGSLERDILHRYGAPSAEAMVESALRHVAILERLDYSDFKISVKSSDPRMAIAAYRSLAARVEQPLHLGITEAGGSLSGTVKSAIGLGALLLEGIGDTLRISLAAPPEEEVRVGWELLKALRLRSRGINLIACPGCARQNFDVINVVGELEQRLADVSTDLDVAVIGCHVNGPGESRSADVGLTGASPQSLAYVDGKKSRKVAAGEIVDVVESLVRERAARPIASEG